MEEGCYIKIKNFGKNKDIREYTLHNNKGCEIDLINYGATIRSIRVPDKSGKIVDIALGFNSVEEYQNAGCYIGCTVGRTAGRIRGGKFTLDGQQYALQKNEKGITTLHGGKEGFDKKIWNTTLCGDKMLKVLMEYKSKDGEEGYPGNLVTKVIFELAEDKNELVIDYQAESDKNTPVNLTNHTYFNLNGEQTGVNILNNEIMLASSLYLPLAKDFVPSGEKQDVSGSPMDFRTQTAIGKRINDEKFEQFKISIGYDHCWLFDQKTDIQCKAFSPLTGIGMEIRTGEPGVVMYTGNFLDGKIKGKSGTTYEKHYGFCLETESVANSVNDSNLPSCILKAGDVYKQHTVFTFIAIK